MNKSADLAAFLTLNPAPAGAHARVSIATVMGVAGARLDMMNISLNVLMLMVVPDAVKVHFIVAAGAAHPVAMDDAADALAEGRATFRAAHADFHVIDGIVHRAMLP